MRICVFDVGAQADGNNTITIDGCREFTISVYDVGVYDFGDSDFGIYDFDVYDFEID